MKTLRKKLVTSGLIVLLYTVSSVIGFIMPVYALASEDIIIEDHLAYEETDIQTDISDEIILDDSLDVETSDVETMAELQTDNDFSTANQEESIVQSTDIGTENISTNNDAVALQELNDENSISDNLVLDSHKLQTVSDNNSAEYISSDGSSQKSTNVKKIIIKYHAIDYGYKVGDEGLKGRLYLDTGDYTWDEVSIDDDEVSVSGFDSSKIGVKSITISYKGKSVKTKIYVGLDPDETPVSYDGAGFNSIAECVNALKKLDRKNLNEVYIYVNKDHTEQKKMDIPKLSSDNEEDNMYGTYIYIDDHCTLTLSEPNIKFGDNGGIYGKIRSANDSKPITVNFTYNKVSKVVYEEWSFTRYPFITWGGIVTSNGGISFVGNKNIDLDFENVMALKILNISKFRSIGSSDGDGINVYGSISGVESLYCPLKLMNPYNTKAEFGSINTDDTEITLVSAYDTDGRIILPQLKVGKVGKIVTYKEYGETWTEEYGNLIIYVVNENNNLIPLPSGTPIMQRTYTKGDDLPKISIQNTGIKGENLLPYNDGKVTRAGLENITIEDDYGNEESYYRLQDALNNMKKGRDYTVTLNNNISVTSMKLPTAALSSIYIRGTNNQELSLQKTTSLTAKYDLTLENIQINTGVNKKGIPNKLTINQNKGNLTLIDVYETNGVSVKGNSQTSLFLISEESRNECSVNGDVTGFGNVYVKANTIIGNKFNVTNLHISKDSSIVVKDNKTLTAKTVIAENGACIMLYPKSGVSTGFKPLELGVVNADTDNKLKLMSDVPLNEGAQILNSKKADLNKFDVTGISPKDGREYTLWRKKANDSKVILKAK